MELRFTRKRLVDKTGVGRGLRVADIHRPAERQRQLFEHGPIGPLIMVPEPKTRVADVLLLDPGPVRVAPKELIFVSTLAHELEKITIRDFIGVDRKGRNVNRMSLKLVVPAKRIARSRNPERRDACWDINHPRKDQPAALGGRQGTIAQRRNLPVGGQLVQHVRQGFRVHEAMLNRHVQDNFVRIFPKARRRLRPLTEDLVKLLADTMVIGLDLRETRPVGGLIRREATAHWINAKCKKTIEFPVSRFKAQRLAGNKIPVECLEVTEVEDDSVPLSNRPVIHRLRADDSKQIIGHRPRFSQAGHQLPPTIRLGCRRIHFAIPRFRPRG